MLIVVYCIVCSDFKHAAFNILIVKVVHEVQVCDHGDTVNLTIPKDDVTHKCALHFLENESEQKLTQLQTREVKRNSAISCSEEELMEKHTEYEGDQ